jgi:tetratricopeptide (TPR) repeat protein
MRSTTPTIAALALSAFLVQAVQTQVKNQAPNRKLPVTIRQEDGTNVTLYEDSHALLIGVSHYKNGWRTLPGVLKDMDQISLLLRNLGFDVDLVLDPTRAEFDQAVRGFVKNWGQAENSRLLIYFAGHGHTLKTIDGRELGYIVPADAPLPGRKIGSFKEKAVGSNDIEVQALQREIGSFKEKAISMIEIENYALQIEAKHALFVFDSCFSGSFFDAMRGDVPDSITVKVAKPVREFITAGSSDQTVPDDSIFRTEFVDGLNGEADLNKDGYVTGSELGMFLEDKVANYSQGTETPRYGKIRNPKLDKGDFVFVLPSSRSAAFQLNVSRNAKVSYSHLPGLKSQAYGDSIALTPGKPVERDLGENEKHSYRLMLAAGQFSHVSLEHQGVGVIVVVTDPTGRKLTEVDGPNAPKGIERITFIAGATGAYQIEIRPEEKTRRPSRYRLLVTEIREATVKDRALQEAITLNEQVDQLYSSGNYDQAIQLSLRVLEIRERELGPNDLAVAEALSNLAKIFQEEAAYAKAEPLYQRALEIRKKILGPEDWAVAASLKDLALLYAAKGAYTMAEPLYLQALSIVERTSGTDSLNVADITNELGSLYEAKGDYKRAEPFYLRALSIREKILGLNNAAVAASLNNLGLTYAAEGDDARAEQLLLRSLEISERTLGANSPYVAQSLHNLGWLYYSEGNYVKAEPLLQRALDLNVKALGWEHPYVAQSLDNLGTIHFARGDYAAAETEWQRALSIREKATGADHPDVATSLANLGSLAQKKGDLVIAEKLYQQSLTIRERTLGYDHPYVAESLSALGVIYSLRHEDKKALNTLAQALKIFHAAGDSRGETETVAKIGKLGGIVAFAAAYNTSEYVVPMLGIPTLRRGDDDRLKVSLSAMMDGARAKIFIEPHNHGMASEVQMRFRDLKEPPLGYVYILWAVSRDNQFQKLGEIMTVNGGEAKIVSEVGFNDFGLLLTIEGLGMGTINKPSGHRVGAVVMAR